MDGNNITVQGTVNNADDHSADRTAETYAQRTARGLVAPGEQAALDAIIVIYLCLPVQFNAAFYLRSRENISTR